MADLWQQFHSLPKAIRDSVATHQSLVLIDALEHEYPGLDLANLVMRIMVHDFKFSELPSKLISENDLTEAAASQVTDRLRRELFVGMVGEYLGLTRPPAGTPPATPPPVSAKPPLIKSMPAKPPVAVAAMPVKPMTAAPANLPVRESGPAVPPPTVPLTPTPPVGPMAPTQAYSDEDAAEIAQQIQKLKTIKPDNINQDLNGLAQDILTNQSLAFSDELMQRRALAIIKARLKDIRRTDETKAMLMREPKVGGLGLDPEIASQISRLAELKSEELKARGMIKPPAILPPPPPPPPVPKTVQAKPIPIPPLTRKFPTVPPPVPIIPNVTEPPRPSRPVVRPPDIPPPPPLPTDVRQPAQPTPVPVATPPKPRPSGPGTLTNPPPLTPRPRSAFPDLPIAPVAAPPPVPPAAAPIPPTVAAPVTPRPAVRLAQPGALTNPPPLTPSPQRPPTVLQQRTQDRPTVADVVRPYKALGPTEEMRSMTLLEFRRLGLGATDSARKILDSFNHLQRESYSVWAEAVAGWRQSAVFQLYLTMGQESLEVGTPISQVIADRGRRGLPYLSEHEFSVIADLSRRLQL